MDAIRATEKANIETQKNRNMALYLAFRSLMTSVSNYGTAFSLETAKGYLPERNFASTIFNRTE
jgi:hypothetical protein